MKLLCPPFLVAAWFLLVVGSIGGSSACEELTATDSITKSADSSAAVSSNKVQELGAADASSAVASDKVVDKNDGNQQPNNDDNDLMLIALQHAKEDVLARVEAFFDGIILMIGHYFSGPYGSFDFAAAWNDLDASVHSWMDNSLQLLPYRVAHLESNCANMAKQARFIKYWSKQGYLYHRTLVKERFQEMSASASEWMDSAVSSRRIFVDSIDTDDITLWEVFGLPVSNASVLVIAKGKQVYVWTSNILSERLSNDTTIATRLCKAVTNGLHQSLEAFFNILASCALRIKSAVASAAHYCQQAFAFARSFVMEIVNSMKSKLTNALAMTRRGLTSWMPSFRLTVPEDTTASAASLYDASVETTMTADEIAAASSRSPDDTATGFWSRFTPTFSKAKLLTLQESDEDVVRRDFFKLVQDRQKLFESGELPLDVAKFAELASKPVSKTQPIDSSGTKKPKRKTPAKSARNLLLLKILGYIGTAWVAIGCINNVGQKVRLIGFLQPLVNLAIYTGLTFAPASLRKANHPLRLAWSGVSSAVTFCSVTPQRVRFASWLYTFAACWAVVSFVFSNWEPDNFGNITESLLVAQMFLVLVSAIVATYASKIVSCLCFPLKTTSRRHLRPPAATRKVSTFRTAAIIPPSTVQARLEWERKESQKYLQRRKAERENAIRRAGNGN